MAASPSPTAVESKDGVYRPQNTATRTEEQGLGLPSVTGCKSVSPKIHKLNPHPNIMVWGDEAFGRC